MNKNITKQNIVVNHLGSDLLINNSSEIDMLENIKVIESCKFYENCDAQLCPLDKTINDKVWYPDEDVCCSGKFKHLGWIKRQKSLRKRKGTVGQGLFTVTMLGSIGRITTKTKGINPDKKKTANVWVARKMRKKQLLLKTNA